MQMTEYGAPIALAAAKKVLVAAEVEASANNWPVVIAVVDSTAHLVALHRMEHAQFGSIEAAQAKALTAVNFKRPTKAFADTVAEGGNGMRLLSRENFCPLEGGIPLFAGGRIIGAIGVSGVLSAQDGQIAAAGARAVEG
ncbi:MAG: heme-binding protein [Pseudomonadota bacterium]